MGIYFIQSPFAAGRGVSRWLPDWICGSVFDFGGCTWCVGDTMRRKAGGLLGSGTRGLVDWRKLDWEGFGGISWAYVRYGFFAAGLVEGGG